MNVLIVYGSQFGNTRRLALAIADAIRPEQSVRVVAADEADSESGAAVDLLLFGTPTQIHGLRILGRPFLDHLEEHSFAGTAAAAFDTRLHGSPARTGSASEGAARRLEAAGCRLVAPPESFLVDDMEGPLSIGELDRAAAWARAVADAAAATTSATHATHATLA